MIHPEFETNGFKIPEFKIESGKMIRFWVEIVPKKVGDEDWGIKKMSEIIDNYNKNNAVKIHFCKNQLKLGIFDFMKPIKLKEYLFKVFGERGKEVEATLETFDIKPYYTLRKMGTSDQKVLSIICGIELNEVIAFDFYGLGFDTVEKLMNYMKIKLTEGKSLIAFDNLNYREEIIVNSQIEHFNIKRV